MNNQTNWIAHHGIKGQKWGVRRYQNEDGSLTTNGKKRRLNLNKINKKIEDFNKKRMHDFKMRTDPLYRRTHSRHPWYEKSTKKDPWDEKPSKTKSLEKSKSKSTKKKNKELKKAFAYEARSSNKTLLGNIYDRITGADKIYAQAKMKTASSAEKQKAIKEYYKTHFKKKKG